VYEVHYHLRRQYQAFYVFCVLPDSEAELDIHPLLRDDKEKRSLLMAGAER
jgi:hypothetical protein